MIVINGEIKSFSSKEKPIFSKVGFEMKESEVRGPVQFNDENNQSKYAVIKCYFIRPEKQLTYNDVKNTIKEDFKNFHRQKIEKELEVELRNKNIDYSDKCGVAADVQQQPSPVPPNRR